MYSQRFSNARLPLARFAVAPFVLSGFSQPASRTSSRKAPAVAGISHITLDPQAPTKKDSPCSPKS